MRTIAIVFGVLVSCFQIGETVRVVGGRMGMYNRRSTTWIETILQFGAAQNYVADGQKWVTWSHHWCRFDDGDAGYCYQKFKIIEDESSTAEHFQIHGTEYKLYEDNDCSLLSETKQAGDVTKGERTLIMHGEAWDGKNNDWGYIKVWFFMELSTQPPLISMFARKTYNHRTGDEWEEEAVGGTKQADDTKVEVIEIAAYVRDMYWRNYGIHKLRYYSAATKLVDFEANFDEMTETSPDELKYKSRTVRNEFCSDKYADGMTGILTQEETIETSESSSFGSTFDFGFSIEATAEKQFAAVRTEVTLSSSIDYGTSTDFSTSKTITESTTYQWPMYCPPKHECEFNIMMATDVREIPVVFTFERSGHQFQVNDVWTVRSQSFSEVSRSTSLKNLNC